MRKLENIFKYITKKGTLIAIAIFLIFSGVIWRIDLSSILPIKTEIELENVNRYINVYGKGIIFILLCAVLSFYFILRSQFVSKQEHIVKILSQGVLIFACFIYASNLFIQLSKFLSYKYYVDFAVHLEVIWKLTNGLSGAIPFSSVEANLYGSTNWFGTHFAPILYLFAVPFYFLPRPEILIVLQTLLIGSAALPLYWYAKEKSNSEASALFITCAFLLYPTLNYITIYDFEYLRFSIPALMFTFYFLYKGKRLLYLLFLVLSLLIREEVSLVTFMLGIYSFFIMRKRKLGLITSMVSIAYFGAVIGYVMPSMRSGGYLVYSSYFIHLGNTPLEILWTLIIHPIYILKLFLELTKIANFILFNLPVLFLSIFSPIFIIILPNFFISFLSKTISVYSIFLYYLSPSIPFIFIAAIDGIKNASNAILPFLQKWGYVRNNSSTKNDSKKQLIFSLAITLFITSILTNFFFGPSIISRQFWDKNYKLGDFHTTNFHYSNYLVGKHQKLAREFVGMIPADATISAEQFFLPHLYRKKKLYVFPTIEDDVEYVLIDKKHKAKTGIGDTYFDFRNRPQYYYDKVEKDPVNWDIVKEEDGIFLLRRKGSFPAAPLNNE